MATNYMEFPVSIYNKLLARFPEEHQEKLRMYTGQELFYIYKLCKYEAKKEADGSLREADWKFLALKAKMFAWLKGQVKRPISGTFITKACSAWNRAMTSFVEEEQAREAEEHELSVAG